MSAANVLSTESASQAMVEPRAAEPSMEDILASIRRIIADDQSRGLAASSMRRAGALNVNPPSAGRPERSPPEVNVPAAESAPSVSIQAPVPTPVSVEPPPLAQAPTAPARDLSARPLRPVAAPLSRPSMALDQAIPHLNPFASPVVVIAPPQPEASLSLMEEIARVGAASILGPAPGAQTAAVASPISEPYLAVLDLDTPVFKPDADKHPPPADEAGEGPARAGVDMPSEEPIVLALAGYEAPAADEGGDPLLSDHAGASVETSFQSLATSVFMNNTAHLDTLMRDMLRPMLKTWLDDNLPTIVERLVRSEIERVARGGRG